MKKTVLWILVVLTVIFPLASCANHTDSNPEITENPPNSQQISVPDGEYRAVWINYNEISMKASGGGTEDSFRAKITEMLDNISAFGLNTVIFHVRPFSDSLYPSEIFPWSKYLSGTQGTSVDYDPLRIVTEEAQKRNLSVEAWINPYRVSYQASFDDLSKDNPAKIWYSDNPQTDDLIITESGIFYNPSSRRAQKLIISGVKEIVKNYAVSAIHMDDYFYPSTDAGIDAAQYSDYAANGGKLSLDAWRRENVNAFVSGLYSAIKEINSQVKLVISPAGDIAKNYSAQYADIKEWCRQSGYLDIIMPQLYYGFENASKPFQKTADEWEAAVENSNIQLCFGMAFYKSGSVDDYAGSGASEWQEQDDICARQILYMRTKKQYYGFAVYSYSYLFSQNKSKISEKEYNNLKSVL